MFEDPAGDARDAADYIVDIRESDVQYYTRVAIDLDVRCGRWYDVRRQVSERAPVYVLSG
jgi:DNA polymerase elongation subunit (family B)